VTKAGDSDSFTDNNFKLAFMWLITIVEIINRFLFFSSSICLSARS
jgi:hypothetical protein